jgi:hypothetical protein
MTEKAEAKLNQDEAKLVKEIVAACRKDQLASTAHLLETGLMCHAFLESYTARGNSRPAGKQILQGELVRAGLQTIDVSRYLKAHALCELVGKDLETVPVGSVIACLPLVSKGGSWNKAIADLPERVKETVAMIRNIAKKKTPVATVRKTVQHTLGKPNLPTEQKTIAKEGRVRRMVAAFAGLGGDKASQAIIGDWLAQLNPDVLPAIQIRLSTSMANAVGSSQAIGGSAVKIETIGKPGDPLHKGANVKPTRKAAARK